MIGADHLARAVDAVARSWIDHADELTRLDQAIGDGDHGMNMKRGAEAVLARRATIAEKPLPEALSEIGHVLVESIGGASGPLYATFFLCLGRSVPPDPDPAAWAEVLHEAVGAVARRGGASLGEKTMLDVLAPAEGAFAAGFDPERIDAAAREGAEATVPMQARRGRASYLCERSIGHMDPGARSSALAVSALCDIWRDGR